MDLSAFYSQFRDETAENVRILNDGLLALERQPDDRAQLDAVFRAVHTIKGSARLLGFEQIGQVAHTIEHILGAVRAGQRELSRALADDLLRGGDALLELCSAAVEGRSSAIDTAQLINSLGRGPRHQRSAAPPASPAPAEPASEREEPATSSAAPATTAGQRTPLRQTIRVRVDRLDRLLNLAGELAVGRQIQAAHNLALAAIQSRLLEQQRNLKSLASELGRLRFSASQQQMLDGHLLTLLTLNEQLRSSLRTQLETFTQHSYQHGLLIDDLEQEVMAARLLPIATLFNNLPRAVRELARESGKQVQLEMYGESTELDRKVIEALGDPLLHLVRNAIDHGIEAPEERHAAGKPATGLLSIRAQALGTAALISITDDGRGMQPARLRETARRKGLLPVDALNLLTEQETLELIFLPGFSTASIITDISGRGVGMDVVRTNVSEIGGQVQVDSQAGQGTTITLHLPLTLVTTRIVLLEAAGQAFALPASGCLGSLWVRREALFSVEGRAMVEHDGLNIPLLQLADLLYGNQTVAPPAARRPAVLIGHAQRPLALLVDRLLDEREAVVKPLGPLFERNRRYTGAVQLGDGRLVLLLNPNALQQAARGTALSIGSERTATQPAARLLVADDSFTTRELIRSILGSAGYSVEMAINGHDALEQLRQNHFDLLVSDIEMPLLDGFQLTRRIRQELQLTLPVVIISSLASEEHRRQGLQAGAQAYIVKSQFDQGNLLETIQQLLGH